uniref:Tyrosine-protein kinase n=1 Tax=Globodera rostochiensis TaxID=31243 RepID=A0A914H770_GLORO
MGHCLSSTKRRHSSQSDDTSVKEFQKFPRSVKQAGTSSSLAQHNNASDSKLAVQTSFSSIGNAHFHHKRYHNHQQLHSDMINCENSPRNEPKPDVGKLVAIFSYESQSDGDLEFQKGDVMYLQDSSNPEWWFVRNTKGRTGFVPRRFIAFAKTPQAKEWFSGRIPRGVAERLVVDNHLPIGTFLIREREVDHLEYALTIRDIDEGHGPCVKHYKIKRADDGQSYFIAHRVTFKSLDALVGYYSERADGLCQVLTIPAPRMVPVRPDLSHDTQHNWEIPRHELQLLCRLGGGNFGDVWFGRWREKVEVAIKTLKRGTMSPDAFLSEANIMKQCSHNNLVRLFAVCTKEEPFFIITEYMPNGSLLSYLRAQETDEQDENYGRPKNPLSMQSMVDICAQVASGMKYLEERKLVHRDLAARNVLVGDKISGVPVVKVADFGLARKLMEEDIYEASAGGKFPIKWTAPEAAIQGSFTVKSDVWSYGILLYEIFTRGAIPYSDLNNKEVIEQVVIGHRLSCPRAPEPDKQELLNRIFEQLMLKCWDENPDCRPTFEALYHYFDDFFSELINAPSSLAVPYPPPFITHEHLDSSPIASYGWAIASLGRESRPATTPTVPPPLPPSLDSRELHVGVGEEAFGTVGQNTPQQKLSGSQLGYYRVGGAASRYVYQPSPIEAHPQHHHHPYPLHYPMNYHHQQHQSGAGKSSTMTSMGSSGTAAEVRRAPVEQLQQVVAVYEYQNHVEGDICFAKGDVMVLLDGSNYDWWYVRHPKNGVGYAPHNFLARIESLESEEWYAGKIQRSMAEKLVLAGKMPRGTFLVRKREGGEFALTINDSKEDSLEVKHYKIRPLDNGSGFFIATRKRFHSVRDLIAYYSKESGGLCYHLTYPAPKVAPVRPDLSYDTAKNWEIPREELDLIDKLGEGNFGEVWLGRWRGVIEIAVKKMKPGTMSADAFLAEAQIMKQCNHPKLVRLYAVCTKGEPYYIVTEYMRNGSLIEYLRNVNNRLSIHSLVDMSAQVASGMMYLESRKLVHRDLAARNVLVGDKISGVPEVKVADFGLARKLMEENIYEAQMGTKFPVKWTAPEAAQYGNFTVKSDVWSYGILLYEIFTLGHTPYPGVHNRDVLRDLENGKRMACPKNCPQGIYQEMLNCWDQNPDRRPTFEYLFTFFDDFFISSQPNYVPPSVDGTVFDVQAIDGVEGEEIGGGRRRVRRRSR